MSGVLKLTSDLALQAAQRVYSETSPYAMPEAQILLTGSELVSLFELLSKDFVAPLQAELIEALKEAVEEIKFLSTRDNSWSEREECTDFLALIAKATGA